MAYVTPITFVALSTLTAAQLNSIQTNISALWPYTAAGDISYASAANTLARLAKGTAGQVLKMKSDASIPEWGSMLGCLAYRSSTQAIPTHSDTPIDFESEYYDDFGFHSTSSNTSRITIPAAFGGRYLIGASCLFESGLYGQRVLKLVLNGVTELCGMTNTIDGGSDPTYLNASGIYQFNACDYIQALVRQNIGSNLNISATNTNPLFWCMKI